MLQQVLKKIYTAQVADWLKTPAKSFEIKLIEQTANESKHYDVVVSIYDNQGNRLSKHSDRYLDAIACHNRYRYLQSYLNREYQVSECRQLEEQEFSYMDTPLGIQLPFDNRYSKRAIELEKHLIS